MTHEQLHAALVALCDKIVTAYRNDLLVHDANNIKAHDVSTPFLHFSRATGTYMVHLIAADKYPAKGVLVPFLFGVSDREHILDNSVTSMVEHCANPNNGVHTCHWWDGHMFRQITVNRANTIAQEYTDRIRQQWKAGATPSKPVTSYVALGM